VIVQKRTAKNQSTVQFKRVTNSEKRQHSDLRDRVGADDSTTLDVGRRDICKCSNLSGQGDGESPFYGEMPIGKKGRQPDERDARSQKADCRRRVILKKTVQRPDVPRGGLVTNEHENDQMVGARQCKPGNGMGSVEIGISTRDFRKSLGHGAKV